MLLHGLKYIRFLAMKSLKEIGFTSIIRGKKGGVIRIHNGRQL